MLYFFLEILIFIAQFFPGSQVEPIGQQKGRLQKKLKNRRENFDSNAEDVSKSATPKPTAGSKTATPQVPSDSAGTQTQVDAVGSDNATGKYAPKPNIERAMVDASTQTEDINVAENHPPDASMPETSSQTIETAVINSDPSWGSAPEGSIGAAEAIPTVQEDLLRTEKASHQETREELARLEHMCQQLQADNTWLQAHNDHVGRENASIRTQYLFAEDASRTQLSNAEGRIYELTTELSNAQGQIHELTNTIQEYLWTIADLQEQVVDLNADVAWYFQLGINVYVRLRKVEKLLHPFDKVFAGYKRLMSDAAQYFSTRVHAGAENGDVHDDAARIEEISNDDHNEGNENDPGGVVMSYLGTNKVACDRTPGSKMDAIQAKEDVVTLDEEEFVGLIGEDDMDLGHDDYPYPVRPMRPGTANRIPVSVFAAMSRDTARNSSSSLFEEPAQQDPSPAASGFPISFAFSEPSVKSNKKRETTTVREPIQDPVHEPVQETVGEPVHDIKDSSASNHDISGRGNGAASTNTGAGPSPAATAFPEHSVKTEGERKATAMPTFRPQKLTNLNLQTDPFTADSNILGNTPEVEQKQGSAQKAGKAPMFGLDDSQGSSFQFTLSTEGKDFTPSHVSNPGPPNATPPSPHNNNIFSMPMEHLGGKSSAKGLKKRPTSRR